MPELSRVVVWVATGAALTTAAFILRVAVHARRSPSGVDTWYYLAYADALRRQPGLTVRLPQYLLQDEVQSYAPLFPSVLALLPSAFLVRWFWLVSPAIDCVQLLLLYVLAGKLTDSVWAAALSASVYTFTPHLISETRSLNGRSFGALLQTVAVVLLIRYSLADGLWPWLPLALLSGAAVFLASASSAAAYGIVSLVLALVLGDPRYVGVAGAALLVAVLVSRGYYLRVIWNYLQAVKFWRRNRHRFGAHPIVDSPVYGTRVERPIAREPGALGANTLQQLVRLFGENPFVLALPLAQARLGDAPWGPRLYWWAGSLAAMSIAATVLPPLRAFGPGRGYMKAAVFPTAYILAAGIGDVSGFESVVGRATLVCLLLSIGSIGWFYYYIGKRAGEHTSWAPPGLICAVARLRELPGEAVLCLPYMYADYVCYNARKRVLWGGHCGALDRFEYLAPVITRPIPELLRVYGVRYVLMDSQYARPGDLGMDHQLIPIDRWDGFILYDAAPVTWRSDAANGAARGRNATPHTVGRP